MVNDLDSRYLDIRWQEILLLSAVDICCIHLLLSEHIYLSVCRYLLLTILNDCLSVCAIPSPIIEIYVSLRLAKAAVLQDSV